MLENITAVYEKGCLRPLQPLNLQENEIVHLTVLKKVVVPKEVIFQANLPERKESPVNIKKYKGIAGNVWQDADAYIDVSTRTELSHYLISEQPLQHKQRLSE